MNQITTFENDSKAPPSQSDSLEQVSKLANRIMELRGEISDIETELKKKRSELDRIESADLPDLMDGLQLSEITVNNNYRISVKAVIKANLPTALSILRASGDEADELKKRLEVGLSWLREQGAGDLIKNKVIAEMGKGSTAAAAALIVAANEMGIEARSEQSVHPMSLSSYIRERIEDGADVPFDIFSVYSGRKATISPPRK